MKNILVIGGAGFIGSHLCKELIERGFKVYSLDNYFTGKKSNHIKGVTYINSESKNIEVIDNFFKPDTIFHLGEYSRVIPSFEDIEKVIEYNYIGTVKVIEYCRKNKIRLIYAGSSTKFGDKESPYSFIKKQNTELIKRYGKWYGLDYAITYFYNVYGPKQICTGKYATVIGIFKENIKKGRPHIINGIGTQKRIFTHVEDIVGGLVLVGELGYGEYCLGSSEQYSIKEVAKMFGGKIKFVSEKQGDRTSSTISLKRIEQLGWKAEHSLKKYINYEKNTRSYSY